MINLQLILLVLVLALLIVQILALIRMKMVFNYLRRLIQFFYLKKKEKAIRTSKIKSCGNCRFHQTYINAGVADEENDFYYRCKLTQQETTLDASCEHFFPEE